LTLPGSIPSADRNLAANSARIDPPDIPRMTPKLAPDYSRKDCSGEACPLDP
jgi:hypothetical protein